MPHKCTNCGNTIPDESRAIFDGCGDCGNQSWVFIEEVTDESTQKDTSSKNTNKEEGLEDNSQKRARTEFVDSDKIPSGKDMTSIQNPLVGSDRSSESSESSKRLDSIDEIRKRLNDQYEGISVVGEGHYEINLTELYRGNDYVIEVGEDGAYIVREASKIEDQ